jgi:UDP-N-acetylglucosamine 4,6-dehydratase
MKIFKNKTILIIGGTGSFGQAFLNRIIKSQFKKINILSRDEKKQEDLRNFYKNSKISFYIGDIRDKMSIMEPMHNVDYVFHAAALKQVPSCEFYPLEAIKTNVLGTQNVLDCAVEAKVKKLIVLSTDKAVYPINAMGMTKALMEKIIIAKSRTLKKNETKVMITRYGNVLFSRGSVLPLFIKQIINKEKITVTDMNMTRFLMTLDDAINLVQFAINEGENGNIYIPKTPGTNIKTLVNALLNIYNYSKSKVSIIGIRHGEKMSETLMSKEEKFLSKDCGKYFAIRPDKRSLNYDKYFISGEKNIKNFNDYTSDTTEQLSLQQTINLLRPLVKNSKSS